MDATQQRYQTYLLGNYAAPAITLVRGEGTRAWDDQGRDYLDFTTGIAVNALGHAHPRWVKAVSEQAAKIAHSSNLFRNEHQGRLAERLVEACGPGRLLFCNSGAEANEALIKLARLHGRQRSGGEEGRRFHILTAQNAFHGRTFGGMAATPQEKIQGGFRPMLTGFHHAPLNDLDAFARLIDDNTAAIMVETIQGEGGIHVCTPDFLRGLRALCDQHDLLLLIDEVQCGIGRSGDFFAYQSSGITPDAIGMAKGLGGGFPIGSIWVRDTHAALFQPGMHGTTFGGNPLACAAALAVLDVIRDEHLLDKVTTQSARWHQQLEALRERHPHWISAIRGRGYLVGLALKADPLPVVRALREEAGLLVVPAGGQVIRLLPPLTASTEELEEATARIDQLLTRLPEPAPAAQNT